MTSGSSDHRIKIEDVCCLILTGEVDIEYYLQTKYFGQEIGAFYHLYMIFKRRNNVILPSCWRIQTMHDQRKKEKQNRSFWIYISEATVCCCKVSVRLCQIPQLTIAREKWYLFSTGHIQQVPGLSLNVYSSLDIFASSCHLGTLQSP